MKKLYSLIKACMTSDMNIFKIKQKKTNKKRNFVLPLFLSLFFMFAIWSNANLIFEKTSQMNLNNVILSVFVFFVSFMTIIEGVYKAGPLLFNCKDDQLLLSLPIEKKTIIFIRVFKFYVFELIFNSLFMIPIILAYIGWTKSIDYTFYITSLIMIIILPIIPIIISCFIGAFISSVSSRFKFKNFAQIALAMLVLLGTLYVSFNFDGIFSYLAKNATSINDLISKIYYPAGLYGKLIDDFNLLDLIKYILCNIIIFIIAIFILSNVYFKINSRLKKVINTKKVKIDDLTIKPKKVYYSLITKELNTFFKTPVFIINSGFALILFIVLSIAISIKFDSMITFLADALPQELIGNMTLLIFVLIIVTSFMTSITNSVISLEGKNINILKSLPVKTKTILMSKVYSGLVITTPILLLGDIILFVRFRTSIIESLLLIILSIIIPLVSHFIGIIINLKYPKLDAENSAEVVKQSVSSFLAVVIGMLLLILNIFIISKIYTFMSSISILIIFILAYLLIDIFLYLFLVNNSTKDFEKLSI